MTNKMLPKALENLINQFRKLPTIGPKSAERLGFMLLKWSRSDLEQFGNALLALKDGVKLCPRCFYFLEHDACAFCDNPYRDASVLCVVETIVDLVALERIGDYNGLYHVLQGRIDPMNGVTAEHIRLRELYERVKANKEIKELIIATEPDVEGETTALYIANLLEKTHIQITRIGRGLPSGGNLEFADDTTLRNALRGRTGM